MTSHRKSKTQRKMVTGLLIGGSTIRHLGPQYIPSLVFICLAALLPSPPADANSVTILNNSFESQVLPFGGFTDNVLTDWTVVAPFDSLVGAYNPNTFSEPVPNGSNTAYLNPGGSFSQDVGPLLAASTYDFTVYVGQRTDIGLPSYNIQLLDASTLAVLASGIPSPPGSGDFVNFPLTFDSASFPADVGNDILIKFSAPFVAGVLAQVNFDDVTLSYVPDGTGPVPEPATITLLGLAMAGLGFSRRRT
jgi:hypothetical protein